MPKFCVHSIGCWPGDDARHWPKRPANECYTRRWLDVAPCTQGPAHLCIGVSMLSSGAALLQRACVNTRTKRRQRDTQNILCVWYHSRLTPEAHWDPLKYETLCNTLNVIIRDEQQYRNNGRGLSSSVVRIGTCSQSLKTSNVNFGDWDERLFQTQLLLSYCSHYLIKQTWQWPMSQSHFSADIFIHYETLYYTVVPNSDI